MAAPFAPLLDTDVPYQPQPQLYTPRSTPPPMIDTGGAVAPTTLTPKKPMNPVIPTELATMEDRLKATGSGTSTLTTVAAWLGAAKGDFKGLAQIEEQKRRTALAKSMAPEVIKVNNMVNSGKWEEAQSYVNEMANSYGQRAPELIPYFDAMAARISKKQEGWENLKGIANFYKETVKEDNVNYPILKALEKAVERRDNLSETSLQGLLTRSAVHVQNLDNRLSITQPQTGETKIEMLPAVVKASDLDNFAGNTVASKHGLDLKQMADLRNGREVKADTGEIITPGSEKDKTIRTQFNALQPINAALEMSKLTSIPPEVTLQLLKDQGLLRVAIRDFGAGVVDKALAGAREQDTAKQVAIIKGTEAEKTIGPEQGTVVHLDETDPSTFLTIRTQPTTMNDVTASGGKLAIIDPTTIGMVRKNQTAIEGLDTAAEALRKGLTLDQTRGDRLAAGAIQTLSGFIGYPITDQVQTRQLVKTILNTAIEQMENTALASPGQIRGGDREDIAKLKAFAAGNYISEADVMEAIASARERLTSLTKMAIGKTPPTSTKKKTPVEVLAPAVDKVRKGTPKGSQITQSGYDEQGKVVVPGELDPELQQKIQQSKSEAIRRRVPVGGSQRVFVPNAPTGTVVQPGQPTGQPGAQQGQPAKEYNALDVIEESSKQKRLQRGLK